MENPTDRAYIKMAEQLDALDFPDVVKMVDLIRDGRYNVLPYLTKVKSTMKSVNPHTLCRCCRLERLNLPNCTNLTNNILVNLPYITSLTINSVTGLTGDIFYHLSYLRELQILSDTYAQPDTLLNNTTVKYLQDLQYLHLYNNILVNEDFRLLKKLKVIVIETNNPELTPEILNFLPHIEICIINKVLYKFISSDKNRTIIKKIGKLDKIHIYALKNS